MCLLGSCAPVHTQRNLMWCFACWSGPGESESLNVTNTSCICAAKRLTKSAFPPSLHRTLFYQTGAVRSSCSCSPFSSDHFWNSSVSPKAMIITVSEEQCCAQPFPHFLGSSPWWPGLAVMWNFEKSVLSLRLRLPWWHLAQSMQYKVSQAVHQVNYPMVKGGFGFKQCPAGSMAATGSEAMPVQGSFTLLQLYPCLKWYPCKYLHNIKKPQIVTPACAFWMAAFGGLQKHLDLAQPVLTLLSWPWALSYPVSISTGAVAVSHIRDTRWFKIAYTWWSVVWTWVHSSFSSAGSCYWCLCWQQGKEAVWKWKEGSKYKKKADNKGLSAVGLKGPKALNCPALHRNWPRQTPEDLSQLFTLWSCKKDACSQILSAFKKWWSSAVVLKATDSSAFGTGVSRHLYPPTMCRNPLFCVGCRACIVLHVHPIAATRMNPPECSWVWQHVPRAPCSSQAQDTARWQQLPLSF